MQIPQSECHSEPSLDGVESLFLMNQDCDALLAMTNRLAIIVEMFKAILRDFLINLTILWGVTEVFPGLTYSGGFGTLAVGAFGLMGMNLIIIPLLKVVFLPLNILTLGIFTWVINVIALYLLTSILPQFKLVPYDFPGGVFLGINFQPQHLTVLWVAIIASFMIGFASRFVHWLTSK